MVPQRAVSDKSQRILDATLALVAEFGFQGATTDLIAKRAGVGAGTIFRYFESKDALLLALYRNLKLEMTAGIAAKVDLTLPIESILRQVWFLSLDSALEDRDRFLFLQQFYNSPFALVLSSELRQSMLAPLWGLFEQAIAARVVRPMPLHLMEIFYLEPVICLARRHFGEALDLDPQLRQAAFEASWRAIRE